MLAELQKESEKDKGFETQLLHIGQDKSKNIDERVISELGAEIHKVGEKILINFPQVSFFEIGYIELNNGGREVLKKFVNTYLPYAGHFTLGIRAYTDSRPVITKRVRFHNNLELSALRSVATMRFLRDSGIPLSNMKLGGFGELRMTRDELIELAGDKKDVKDLRAFTRKVVLVIEPLEKNILVKEEETKES